MYEKYDSYNPAELHSQDIMKYEELSLSELMGKEVVEIIPQTEGKGTVSQRNTVKREARLQSKHIRKKDINLSVGKMKKETR